MTFQEIYEQVRFEAFGDSIPNNSMINYIRGTGTGVVNNGLIAKAHKKVQDKNNFWFMMMTEVIQLQVGIQSYTLNDYTSTVALENKVKELISLVVKDQDDKFHEPLQLLRTGDAQRFFWPSDGQGQQYPTAFEMFGDELVIYPDITESNELHFIYYGYADRPPVNDDLFSQSEGDPVTMYAGDIIAQYTLSDVARVLKDWDLYKAAEDNANRMLLDLKIVDNQRRHALIHELPYIDC